MGSKVEKHWFLRVSKVKMHYIRPNTTPKKCGRIRLIRIQSRTDRLLFPPPPLTKITVGVFSIENSDT